MPGPMSVPNGNAQLLAMRAFVEKSIACPEGRTISVGEQRERLLARKKLDTGKTRVKRKKEGSR